MKGKIFNAQEVQAIIAKNKTMFREICKIQPSEQRKPYLIEKTVGGFSGRTGIVYPFGESSYKKGQKIFVKESFNIFASQVSYKQGLVGAERYFWKPAQHMKQEHSRLTLEITDIKVERLQDISEDDAVNEGVWNIQEKGSPRNWDIKNAFATFWNATHKKPEEKFEANPFVWVVDFKINK